MRTSSLLGFFFIITLSLGTFASWDKAFSESSCQNELKALLNNYKVKNNWFQAAAETPEEGQRAFRSETADFAHWIEVRLIQKQAPVAIYLTPTKTDLIKFDPKCQTAVKTTKVERPKSKSKGVSFFTDDDLKKLVESKKPGMIYAWSPGMVYSVEHFGRFRKAARDLKINFIAVVDPMADEKSIRQVQSQHREGYENRKLAALDLQMRNMTTHYPTAVLYDKGQISQERLIGVMEELELRSRIKNSLGTIK